MSENYFKWLKNRMASAVPAEDSSLNLARHDKVRHGGHFDPETMTCRLRDELKRIDDGDILQGNDVENVLAKTDQAEFQLIEKGSENPNQDKFQNVSIGDLSTFGQTDSKYRNLRNSVYADILRRQEQGEEGLDGSYSFGPPPHKIQHVGEDGEMLDGYADGFQVSFQTTNGEGFDRLRENLLMPDSEYDKTVDELSRETGSEPVVGIFGGIPEVSFRCDTMEQAMEIAKKYNQVSICDNRRVASGVFDDETFPANDFYDWTRN